MNMDEGKYRLISFIVIAILTVLFVYKPWRPRKKCPSCGLKVDREATFCPRCNVSL